jgi:hypothetical protein
MLPDFVISAFNQAISGNFANGRSSFTQAEVVRLILNGWVPNGTRAEEIDKNGWLNVEDAYRDAGWEVKYEKPGCDETGEATFTFTARRGK